ncbi:MAG: type II toxin-antitoxin system PemK/MazF family toxin [Gammaproteobacteria bacterium]|nr:type II toxin-antitoxin system PemK/MazF family toxin [Gammaproteobacteria bacterium]
MEIARGDLVTIALSGDYGKPRPALVIQDDAFSDLPSVAVLRLTSDVHDWPLFRVSVKSTKTNGLKAASQVMVDKPAAVPKSRIGRRIGRIDSASLREVNVALARFLGIATI